ncbi:chymotrypsin family serine protease [Alicyclobacillus dauci]|uniref:S1 family peptidase n=1 Tax=Alicyclobacillus dauci TaxID=1475485 RepID=A0ABY6Z4G9_9BACL|nr:hypothetical protein [Alicyclobacillus dauci]WAH37774.1 S1 family peptidase [Alicyclobacillus dauci]
MANFRAACHAKSGICQSLLKKRGVVGVGVGYADSKNPKKGAAVIVYTRKAATASNLSLPQNVTVRMQGKPVSVPVRFIASGPIFANGTVSPTQFRGRIRPVPGGYSVGYPSIPGSNGVSGTAGIIGINFPGRNQLYICSNNHVLNRNNSTGFTETIQPGAADGGRSGPDTIGRLDRFVPLRKDAVNFLDAATSIPLSNSLLDPRYALVGALPGHLLSYGVGERFKKVGRTTGFVRGTVESINVDVNVNYGNYGGLGVIRFTNQTVVVSNTPISLPGDSGSIWLRDQDNFVAAVNFAGPAGGLRSICFPFNTFAQVFGIRVARPGRTVGAVKMPKTKRPYAHTRPLTKQQLAKIKVVTANRMKRR